MKTTTFRVTMSCRTLFLWSRCSLDLFALVLLFQLPIPSALAEDLLDRRVTLDIPANTRLEDALIEWGTEVGVTVMINTSTVSHQWCRGISGTLSAREALTTLLRNSGLSYTEDGERIRIVSAAPLQQSTLRKALPNAMTSSDDGFPTNETSTDESESETPPRPKDLDEVIVTAQKREERLLDVPVPVTVIDAESLVDTNQVSLANYFTSIPSLTYHGGVPTIRGLNSGAGSNAVAVLIDGVPYGSSGGLGPQLANLPDLDPGALARVEVLRGPQGTLYGANGLGGLINFVTVDPSTDRFSGRIQADLSSVYAGDGPGYGVRGMVNIPLRDTLAIRANIYARRDPGYVDNIQTGQSGVNWGNAAGGRLAALWRPSDVFSLQLTALLQNSTVHGSPNVFVDTPGFGDLQQSYMIATGWTHVNTQQYGATVKAKLGSFDFTSISAYSDNFNSSNVDTTNGFGALVGMAFPATGPSSFQNTVSNTRKFTEELRLSTTIGTRMDWLGGAFYTHERSPISQIDYAANGATGAPVGLYVNFSWTNPYDEYAAFTDFTFHFTDRFDVQFGGRESYNKQEYNETDSGPYVPANEGVTSPAVYPQVNTSQSSFTYLVTPRFKVSNNFMIYARIASGYRPGGPNPNDYGTLAKLVPTGYGADKTKNYELGAKGEAFNHTLTFDTSVYYIDWNNLQVYEFNPANYIAYLGNAGNAKSQGVEFSVVSTPLKGLTLAGWVSLNDAEITKGFPAVSLVYAAPGDKLPNSARLTGNFSVQQDFPLTARIVGFVGIQESYVGEQLGNFSGSPSGPRQVYPSYAKMDLRAGVRYEAWAANLFANNATDKRGFLTGGINAGVPGVLGVIPPRTIGLSVSRAF